MKLSLSIKSPRNSLSPEKTEKGCDHLGSDSREFQGHPLLQDRVDGFVKALGELSAKMICPLSAGICEEHDASGDT